MTSMDTVSHTRLAREIKEVQQLLINKRGEYTERMERVREREEDLKKRRAQLQDRLVEFYRFIQENQVKRNRALNKLDQEKAAKEDKHQQIIKLRQDLDRLEHEKQDMRERFHKFLRYQKYLEDVMNYNEENYTDTNDIILRGKTLEDNHKELQQRRKYLQREKDDQKTLLGTKKKRKEDENLEMQHQLDNLQTEFGDVQKEVKAMQDSIDKGVETKGRATKEIGQVRMAVRNLYDRCAEFNKMFRIRSQEDQDKDVLNQLQYIGYCLDDYMRLMEKRKEAAAKERQQKILAGELPPKDKSASKKQGDSTQQQQQQQQQQGNSPLTKDISGGITFM
eukprot:PhM_4_TR10197/c0_g1_i1/m.29449